MLISSCYQHPLSYWSNSNVSICSCWLSQNNSGIFQSYFNDKTSLYTRQSSSKEATQTPTVDKRMLTVHTDSLDVSLLPSSIVYKNLHAPVEKVTKTKAKAFPTGFSWQTARMFLSAVCMCTRTTCVGISQCQNCVKQM